MCRSLRHIIQKEKMKKLILMIAGAALIASCNNNSKSGSGKLSGEVKIDGSSTVYPITEAVAEEFRKMEPEVKITAGISGTGGGFKKFGRGETDMSDASRPIKEEELSLCKENKIDFIEIPVAFDGLAIVVNKDNSFVDQLTVAELKKIWEPEAQGKITSWKQIRASFPDVPLHLYGAGVASGTYDYFTEAIVGKAKSSRGDYTASEDDNVLVQGVASDKGGLGFFGLEYFTENKDKLKLVPVNDENDANGAGAIIPTMETVTNGTYAPLSRPLFIYVNAKSADRPEVASFVEYYMTNGAKLTAEVGSIALPAEIYTMGLERFKKKVTGSVFSGKSTVGMKIADMMKAEK